MWILCASKRSKRLFFSGINNAINYFTFLVFKLDKSNCGFPTNRVREWETDGEE